ncbi:transmembrane protein, putative [Medicago truncatula]|uniref:Transmembrane protein, putative n=1 Tax=Medicago truncatula TaxID=3880 RepID=A0A072VF48_MEDTR|nr:transmembrane protein, putative [Medicago truncatula]
MSGLSSMAAVRCNMESNGRAYNTPFFLSYVLMIEPGHVLYLCFILGYFCIGNPSGYISQTLLHTRKKSKYGAKRPSSQHENSKWILEPGKSNTEKVKMGYYYYAELKSIF